MLAIIQALQNGVDDDGCEFIDSIIKILNAIDDGRKRF
jgi:hypothetical protein